MDNTQDRLLKKRITVSIDPALFRLLDKRNRSGHVETIIREHFQYAAKEKLFGYIENRLLQKYDIKERIFNEEGVEMVQTPYGLQEKAYE